MMPRIHYIDTDRDMEQLQRDLLLSQAREMRKEARTGSCIFDGAKTCRHCFQCIGLINQKRPGGLSLMESPRLMEYKMNQPQLEPGGDFQGEGPGLQRRPGADRRGGQLEPRHEKHLHAVAS